MALRSLARLTAPVLAVSALLLVCGVGAAWYMHRLQRSATEILEADVTSVRAAYDLEIAVRELRSELTRILLSRSPKPSPSLPRLRSDVTQRLQDAEQASSTDYERDLLVAAQDGCRDFIFELDRLTLAPPSGGLNRVIYAATDRILNDRVLPPIHEYLAFNEQALENSRRESRELTGRLVWAFLTLGVCGAGAGLAAGLGAAAALRRSIVQIKVRLEDTAGRITGKLRPVNITSAPGDDIGKLDVAAQYLADSIAAVLDRLQQSRDAAKRAEQLAAVGQMAAGIAHEVRNPLTAIKVLVQAAVERGDEGQICGRHLNVLDEEVRRLERLISTFLDFARPPRPEMRRVDFRAVLSETLELLAHRAELHGVTIRTTSPTTPIVIDADPDQLRQLLFNLIINALEASAHDSVVEVALTSQDYSIELRVLDRGVGLPDELGDQIYEPFVSSKDSGLGLGLSICRRIVEDHGGTLQAANRPGGGAVFAVQLPILSRNDQGLP